MSECGILRKWSFTGVWVLVEVQRMWRRDSSFWLMRALLRGPRGMSVDLELWGLAVDVTGVGVLGVVLGGDGFCFLDRCWRDVLSS